MYFDSSASNTTASRTSTTAAAKLLCQPDASASGPSLLPLLAGQALGWRLLFPVRAYECVLVAALATYHAPRERLHPNIIGLVRHIEYRVVLTSVIAA